MHPVPQLARHDRQVLTGMYRALMGRLSQRRYRRDRRRHARRVAERAAPGVPPAHELIDPAKDTAALVSQVRAGFVPLPLPYAVEMVKEANAALDDAGVSLDTDPRRVNRSGAAQIAAVEIAVTGVAMPQQPEQTAISG
jgi:hypothetical protein